MWIWPRKCVRLFSRSFTYVEESWDGPQWSSLFKVVIFLCDRCKFVASRRVINSKFFFTRWFERGDWEFVGAMAKAMVQFRDGAPDGECDFRTDHFEVVHEFEKSMSQVWMWNSGNENAMTGQQDARTWWKCHSGRFLKENAPAVSYSCLNEKVVGNVYIVQWLWPRKGNGTRQHSTDITSSNTRREHPDHSREARCNSHSIFSPFVACPTSQSKIQKTNFCSEHCKRRCSSFSRCRCRLIFVFVAPRTPAEFTREIIQHFRCTVRHRSDDFIVIVGDIWGLDCSCLGRSTVVSASHFKKSLSRSTSIRKFLSSRDATDPKI